MVGVKMELNIIKSYKQDELSEKFRKYKNDFFKLITLNSSHMQFVLGQEKFLISYASKESIFRVTSYKIKFFNQIHGKVIDNKTTNLNRLLRKKFIFKDIILKYNSFKLILQDISNKNHFTEIYVLDDFIENEEYNTTFFKNDKNFDLHNTERCNVLINQKQLFISQCIKWEDNNFTISQENDKCLRIDIFGSFDHSTIYIYFTNKLNISTLSKTYYSLKNRRNFKLKKYETNIYNTKYYFVDPFFIGDDLGFETKTFKNNHYDKNLIIKFKEIEKIVMIGGEECDDND